ncbi:MAG: 2-phospho-L-lactate guanylyltransferase [Chloroflexota bacterium]
MSVSALIPIGSLEAAKSRLGAVLDAEERRELVLRMLRRTVGACLATSGIDETIVVSPDHVALAEAERLGARPLRQIAGGLNEGVRQARDDAIARGATAVLVVPVDLPLVTPDALQAVVEAMDPEAVPPEPLVALVADRHGRGTNALLIAPPDAIDPCFGGDSAAAHRAAAMTAGARLLDLAGPLAVDLDTMDDLLLVEDLAPDLLRAG